MKKGKLFTKLAVFGTCLCAPLLLAGCTKEAESKVEFRVQDGYIQVTEDGETWKNLVDIDDLKGQPGQPGQAVDGKQVEFQATETHIQWRYVGDDTWEDLIALDEIDGEDASVSTYTITYDYNTSLDMSGIMSNYKTSQTVKSNE